MKVLPAIAACLLVISCAAPVKERRGVVIYPSDITSVGVEEWAKRIDESGINLVGIHAATLHEPLDTLKEFVGSPDGKAFLKMCADKGVDVEYELHALQLLLPRELFDTHPEYFRMDTCGVRQRKHNMCFCCDEAYDALEEQIREMLTWLHPTTHRYFIWTDDVKNAFCNCEKCREYSPSEQALIYENHLLKILRKYDSRATIAHLAYQQTMDAPVKVTPDDGVFLEYAPILRDYTRPLPAEDRAVLEANLEVFPHESLHILEYWLDESMFSNWKRNALVKLPFSKQNCRRDINLYRNLGATSITTFATWLNSAYAEKHGPADDAFIGYGEAFSNGECDLDITIGAEPFSFTGFHAPWDELDDATVLTCRSTADSLFFDYVVKDSTLTVISEISSKRDIEPEDRVEVFFSSTPDMKVPYFGFEVDPLGRVLDYTVGYYRDFDYGWSLSGIGTAYELTEDGYRVTMSFSRDDLSVLGINTADRFWIGAFRADFRLDGSVNWYSLRSNDDEYADFHKPNILIPCKVK